MLSIHYFLNDHFNTNMYTVHIPGCKMAMCHMW